MKPRPYNDKERRRFAKTFSKLMAALGMEDWNWEVKHKSLAGDRVAEMRYNTEARTATAVLTTKPVDPTETNDPARAACHELVHLLLADYERVAEQRFADARQLSLENEKIAVRLEKLLARLI